MTNTIGSQARPLRVAIIGSGPSGFYAAESLLKQEQSVEVDMFDRLPVPYGLVRYGVAPDHQNIKAVIRQYEKFASYDAFRFFGNVTFGKDIGLNDLRKCYDQIILATGCESDRQLNISGEDAEGSYSATEFVAWYNGHPDYTKHKFNLNHKRAVIVGVGNVAMDVTRILLKDRDELAKSDIATYALNDLRESAITEVILLGRRGAPNAAFSSKEIKEIGELDGVDIIIDPKLLEGIDTDSLARDTQKNITYLQEKSLLEPSGDRKVILKFLASPVEITNENGQVSQVKIERNALVTEDTGRQLARGTGEFETIDAGTVFRSIGYNGLPLPDVPFDESIGRIPNTDGRVHETGTQNVVPGLYVVGWIKRGPSGLVGSNKPDSAATVAAMIEDLAELETRVLNDIQNILDAQNILTVSFADWKKLDELEIASGEKLGKVRDKFTSIDDMIAALR